VATGEPGKRDFMKLHEHVVYWLDTQISVEDGSFFLDFSRLAGLPLVPCVLVSLIWSDSAAIRSAALIAGLSLCIPWTILIIRRRRKKKRDWVEPEGFVERGKRS
jgi:hypothetical protein